MGVSVYNKAMKVKRLHMITLPNDRNIEGVTPRGFFSATLDHMRKVFGEPSEGFVNGFTTYRWIRDIDGVQVVIYDQEVSLDTGAVVEWRVEGRADNCLQLVTESLAERPI